MHSGQIMLVSLPSQRGEPCCRLSDMIAKWLRAQGTIILIGLPVCLEMYHRFSDQS